MQDSHVYAMLLSLYEQIREQQKICDETVLVTQSLHDALCETLPGFATAYDRIYKRVLYGPLGQNSAVKLQRIDELIEELGKLIQKRSQS